MDINSNMIFPIAHAGKVESIRTSITSCKSKAILDLGCGNFPTGKRNLMSIDPSVANAKKSKKRARFEHVFADQKGPMDFSISNVGLARAEGRTGIANICRKMRRVVPLERRMAAGRVYPEFGNKPPKGQE